jgi:hypothetical protein
VVAAIPTETIAIIGLVVAVLGLALSLIALVWQVVAWRMTGSVVKVETGRGILTGPQGLGPDVLTVTARNVGRTQVAVTGWAFRLPSGESVWPSMGGAWKGPATPYTIEAGHEAEWLVPEATIRESLIDHGDLLPLELRGFVNLATGQQVIARRGIRIA